ncbi:TIGR01777 family oxidoreductase [Streptomyces longwoodensis]|nr:TIGR01777 family oxidoreductase [Streptomyces longwoodensis]WRY88233.1 TIGR01777 family oxidoreductase [Streptomyces longwoodensis]WTI47475.1 TIGR01777 family oxidoreductase [Streptomyces longwoodensis]WUC60220.1 TIGR01777 family oxidoreductase [Streptomyces longwoodensis]WUC73749.1 TIGR01777 family oxidoreductase [Streptomyces longwoodensis]
MGRMRRIAVAGASGLIGNALVRSLTADGHEVRRLVRRAARGPQEVCWDPEREYVDAAGLAGCDAVVNLAGAGVGDRRWSEAYKKRIHDSRVLGTRALARAVAALDEPPRVLVNGSAMGIYGETGERIADEDAPPGRGFLPELCVEWEAAAAPAEEAGVRTAFARTGLVVARQGGAWGRLFPLFKAGLGGRMGDGRQYWSYIALHDEVAAIRHLLDRDDLSGPFNLTAPEPLTNREITEAMGRVLGRPTVFAVPAPVLRTVLGEMAGDVLGSARVVPRRLLESGFRFAFPGIDDAIRAALA